MAVTHAPAGFTGTVDQIDEARRFALGGGGRFRVASSADWLPTASSTVNRTVNIAAGSGVACGVLDVTTAADSLTFAANAGGADRFDVVVATFDWSTGSITFRVVQGTAALPVIARTGTFVDTAKINWLPGTRYDAVLGVIRVRPGVTILAPADLYDCRPWGAWNQLNVTTATFGTMVDLDANGRIRDITTGRIWEWNGTALAQVVTPGVATKLQQGDQGGVATINVGATGTIMSVTQNFTVAQNVRVVLTGHWGASANAAAMAHLTVDSAAVAATFARTRLHNLGTNFNDYDHFSLYGEVFVQAGSHTFYCVAITDPASSAAAGYESCTMALWG